MQQLLIISLRMLLAARAHILPNERSLSSRRQRHLQCCSSKSSLFYHSLNFSFEALQVWMEGHLLTFIDAWTACIQGAWEQEMMLWVSLLAPSSFSPFWPSCVSAQSSRSPLGPLRSSWSRYHCLHSHVESSPRGFTPTYSLFPNWKGTFSQFESQGKALNVLIWTQTFQMKCTRFV